MPTILPTFLPTKYLMADHKHLKLRFNKWYFQRRVPKSIRHLYVGKEILELNLDTGDIRQARILRDAILGRMKQQELEINSTSPEKARFNEYLEEMKLAKAGGNYGSTYHPLYWFDVMDPYTAQKENDTEYNAAFSAVLKGLETHPDYRLSLKETLAKFVAESRAESLHTSGTLQRYEATTKLFLASLNTKDIILENIDRTHALSLINLYRGKVSGGTLYGHISRLKTLWEFAYRHAWIKGDNPFDRHKINTRKDRKQKESFTVEEIHNLVKAFSERPKTSRLLMWLGYFTGARISELIAIRVDSISNEAGVSVFKIRCGKTSAAIRTIPVPERCNALFNEVLQSAISASSDFLLFDLYDHNHPDRPAYFATKMFGDLKRKYVTTRSDKGSHSFRVMLSTAAHQAGANELQVAYLIGHSRKGLTMTYDYYSKGYNVKQLLEIQNIAIKQLESNMQTKEIPVC